MDFIGKHPCVAISIVGILLILLSFFIGQLAAYGFALFFLLYLAGIVLVVINIAAMLLVTYDKPAAGVILSLPFGGLGAMIGLLFNPSYDKEKAVKIIFSIQLWIVIWALASFILFALDYYSIGPLPG
ncbi:MAG: hypothetical protein K2J72_12520 [Oscillospiraceae bacterium]|nr:hypothetical protein [Oscillospiraceae bacterium]